MKLSAAHCNAVLLLLRSFLGFWVMWIKERFILVFLKNYNARICLMGFLFVCDLWLSRMLLFGWTIVVCRLAIMVVRSDFTFQFSTGFRPELTRFQLPNSKFSCEFSADTSRSVVPLYGLGMDRVKNSLQYFPHCCVYTFHSDIFGIIACLRSCSLVLTVSLVPYVTLFKP
jgi:hypothetical protein